MNILRRPVLTLVAGAAILTGCATQPGYQSQYPAPAYPTQSSQSQYYFGTVDRIEVIHRNDPNNIAGTVIGGIIGGLIGSQIGGGSGQTVATVAGVAGGAYAGNQMQRQRAATGTFRVTVRLNTGAYQTVTTDNITDLRTGDRVRVDGNTVVRY